MKYYLGIDIGNTKTSYALADSKGEIVSFHIGLGTNHQAIGKDEVSKRLKAGIEELLGYKKIALKEIAFAYFGACGADTPAEFKMLRKLFKELLGVVPFDFDNDGIIALKNGVEAEQGIVITCGTGNTNFAVNAKGEIGRIGGLCEFLGDNFGSALIAQRVMYAASRCQDERDFPSILARRICENTGVKSITDHIDASFEDSALVKKINQAFFKAADEGDGKALELSWEFTKEIIRIMEYFLLRMFDRSKKFRLVLDGHVFTSGNKAFMKMITLALAERYPLAQIVFPECPPVLGALYFAFEKDGKLTEKIISNLKESYKKEVIK